MSEVPSPALEAEPERAERLRVGVRRLHSLTGAFPLAAFVVLHVLTLTQVLVGPRAFGASLHWVAALPGRVALELLLVGAPLVVHGALGVWLMFSGQAPLRRANAGSSVLPLVQRWSALVAGAFIVAHLAQLRWRTATGALAAADLHQELAAQLASTVAPGIPLVALAYLVGVSACLLHLTLGLGRAANRWGITRSQRAAERLERAIHVGGTLLWAIAALVIVQLATGTPAGWW